MTQTTIKFCLLIIFLALAECKNEVTLDSKGIPTTLMIGAFVNDGPNQTMARYVGMAKYLEKKLGMKVKIILTSDYTSVVESLRAKKIHMADISPFAYVITSHWGVFRPIILTGHKGSPYTYKSIIITHKNSGVKNMEDVRAKAKQLTLCFTDPASSSGHLIPRGYLTKIGIDPASFKQMIFASSHSASIMTVNSGKVDIGCTFESGLNKLVGEGIIKQGDIKVLWTSDPIVDGPVVIRNDINEEFVKKVQQAFLEFPREEPLAWRNYLEKVHTNPEQLDYMIAHDSMYNGIRNIVAGIKDLKVIQ